MGVLVDALQALARVADGLRKQFWVGGYATKYGWTRLVKRYGENFT
jgi:hypothetical protein